MGIGFIFFLFLDENIYCGYSLEAPCRGASNEYPQYMFSLRRKKITDTFWLRKVPYEELCIFLRYFVFEPPFMNDQVCIGEYNVLVRD